MHASAASPVAPATPQDVSAGDRRAARGHALRDRLPARDPARDRHGGSRSLPRRLTASRAGSRRPDAGLAGRGRVVDVIVDRWSAARTRRARLDSIETAFAGAGPVPVVTAIVHFVRGWRCSPAAPITRARPTCSAQRPLGACPRCEGLGRCHRARPGRIVPDRRSRSARGDRALDHPATAAARSTDRRPSWASRRRPVRAAHAEQVRRSSRAAGRASRAAGFFERWSAAYRRRPGFLSRWRRISPAPNAAGRGCGPRRWRSGSAARTSPSCRR